MPPPDERAIVLFDGTCNLCNGSVRFIRQHDSKDQFRFVPSQTPEGQELAARFGFTGPTPGSIVLIEGDRWYTRSTASLRMARRLDGPWKLLSVFSVIPRPLRDGVYRIIAKNRHRWFGRAEECEIVQSDRPADMSRK
ncbi:MAG TPA: DCC1-like thiol-disulfide oxidoreductase family protein [Tepidisphaeraceae bacterium]|nr:DCC1-like thiol-disulfide oxidoreductase family protein [Tepidisphaeraceae bacterium]